MSRHRQYSNIILQHTFFVTEASESKQTGDSGKKKQYKQLLCSDKF